MGESLFSVCERMSTQFHKVVFTHTLFKYNTCNHYDNGKYNKVCKSVTSILFLFITLTKDCYSYSEDAYSYDTSPLHVNSHCHHMPITIFSWVDWFGLNIFLSYENTIGIGHNLDRPLPGWTESLLQEHNL